MTDGFPNKPKILRGAFVEFGLTLPPLLVVFQFNPVELTRNRGLTFSVPGSADTESAVAGFTLQQVHRNVSNLLELQYRQLVTVEEQTIGFEIRLDATDKLDDGDAIVEQFGIAGQIATLELMVTPKDESLIGAGVSGLLGKRDGFSFTRGDNPPLVLFIFGRRRVLPVNINSLNITETEFSTDLYPIRATAAVSLTVIEGKNVPYRYSKVLTEAMSVLDLANMTDVKDVVLPG
jgi:hypothetical protein